MANYYQGVDGAWEVANWSTGVLPTDFDGAQPDNLVPGSISVDIAGTDQKGIYPATLEFATGYRHNIGSSGDPLIITGKKITHRGSGSLWIKSDNDANDDPPQEYIDWLIIDSDNMSNAANVDGEEVTKVSVRKGNVTLAATLGTVRLPAQVDVSFRNNRSNDAVVTIDCELLAATGLLNMMAGLCVTNAEVPNVNITGGIHTHSNVNSTDIGMANIGGTGIMRFNSTGTLGVANVLNGGTLDLLDNELAKDVTILNLFPGGLLRYNPDLFNGKINDMGGIIQIVKGAVPAGGAGFGGAGSPAGF